MKKNIIILGCVILFSSYFSFGEVNDDRHSSQCFLHHNNKTNAGENDNWFTKPYSYINSIFHERHYDLWHNLDKKIQKSHENYDFLISPFSAFILGGQQAGFSGAIVGFIFGAVDELFVQMKFCNKHYLNAVIIGMAATSKLDMPYNANKVLGATLGILFTSGGREKSTMFKVDTIMQPAIFGACMAGVTGALAGAGAGIADELLMDKNITDKHYLSNILAGLSTVRLFSPSMQKLLTKTNIEQEKFIATALPLEKIFGILLGSYYVFQEKVKDEKSLDISEICDRLYGIFDRLIDKDDLDKLIEKQTIVILTGQMVLANLGLQLSKHHQNIGNSIAGLKNVNDEDVKEFSKTLFLMLYFTPINFMSNIAFKVANEYYANKLNNIISDKVYAQFMLGEAPLKLSQNHRSKIIINKMDHYIDSVVQDGSCLISEFISKTVNGAFYVSFLASNNAVDLVVFLNFHNFIAQYISQFLSEWELSFGGPLKKELGKVSSIKSEFFNNAHLIVIGDKNTLLKEKLEKAIKKQRKLTFKQNAVHELLSVWYVSDMIFGSLLNYYLVGSKIIEGKLNFDKYGMVSSAVHSAAGSIAWQNKNIIKLSKLKSAILSLNNLLDQINEEDDKSYVLSFSNENSTQIGMDLKNVTIGVENRLLAKAENISLNTGVYAITGESGCGKSSFLSKIKGIVNNNIWTNGNITYKSPNGEKPSLMYLSQEDYLAPYSNLLELVLSKSLSEEDSDYLEILKDRVHQLFAEIKLNIGDKNTLDRMLESEKNWNAVLSGGQKRKLAIVSLIMQKPDVAILDETFNHMDKKSVKTAQEMLRRYLPNTLFLIIDHHYQDNNHDDFYEHRLNFENKKITLVH